MDLGGVFRQRVVDGQDRRTLFILHLDQLEGLEHDLLALRRDERDRVADVAALLANRDHHRPVVLEVPLVALAGDVVRREHRDDAGKSLRLARVDALDERARCRRAKRRSVEHAGHDHVLHVFAGADRLLAGVDARHVLSDPKDAVLVRRWIRPFAQHLRRQFDRQLDLLVTRAATDVAANGALDLRARGRRIDVEQPFGAHHHTWDAETALHGPRLRKGPAVDVLFPFGKALQRDELFPLRLFDCQKTCTRRLPVDENHAGATRALAATVFGGSHPRMVAQPVEQVETTVEIDGAVFSV